MITLYRRTGTAWEYWEAWADGNKAVFHVGVVGGTGRTDESPAETVAVAAGRIAEQESYVRGKGFTEAPPGEWSDIEIRIPVAGWGSEQDLDLRHGLEEMLDHGLSWTGNGRCDGRQMGSGSMEIFCCVLDADAATLFIEDYVGRARHTVRDYGFARRGGSVRQV